jgi:hypothetical protein
VAVTGSGRAPHHSPARRRRDLNDGFGEWSAGSCLTLSADRVGDNRRLTNTIVAMITSLTSRANEPTQFLIDICTTEGKQTGLRVNSVVNCAILFTIEQSKVLRTIGWLTALQLHGGMCV